MDINDEVLRQILDDIVRDFVADAVAGVRGDLLGGGRGKSGRHGFADRRDDLARDHRR